MFRLKNFSENIISDYNFVILAYTVNGKKQ